MSFSLKFLMLGIPKFRNNLGIPKFRNKIPKKH